MFRDDLGLFQNFNLILVNLFCSPLTPDRSNSSFRANRPTTVRIRPPQEVDVLTVLDV